MLRSLFGEPWQSPPRTDRAVVDEFPQELSIQNITALLSAVGFSSPPAWLRPRETLSNGQRFRAEMAMALAFAARDSSALLLDEFTSVVDRHAAKIGCVAFAKKIHQANIRLVAASCHDDILEWLQPDWVARPDLGTQPAEQFALGVLVALGHHRAVQMQQRAVDALGGGQEHVTDLVEQRVVDIA